MVNDLMINETIFFTFPQKNHQKFNFIYC